MPVSKSSRTTDTSSERSKRKKRKDQKKSKKPKRRGEWYVKIDGIYKTIIPPHTQKALEIAIDEDISIEEPWKFAKKDLIEVDIELYEEESCFKHLKEKIDAYPKEEILLGYSPNLEVPNEFYICLTESAETYVLRYLAEDDAEKKNRLRRGLNPSAGYWHTLGSEDDVRNEMNINNRPLYHVHIESRYPMMPSKIKFNCRNAEDARDGYVELLYNPSFKITNVQRRLLDVGTQAGLAKETKATQTSLAYPKNKAIQYEYNYDTNLELSKEFKNILDKFIKNNMDDVLEKLTFNAEINLYSHDYEGLVREIDYANKILNLLVLKDITSLLDVDLCSTKQISSMSWHHFMSGIIAVAYVDFACNVNTYSQSEQDASNSSPVFKSKQALLWSISDELNYKLYLDTPREITSISCCPFDANIIIGGLDNGQIVLWDIKDKLEITEQEEILTVNQRKYRTKLFAMLSWMKNTKNLKHVSVTAISDLFASHMDVISKIEWIPENYAIQPNGHITKAENSLQFMTSSFDGYLMFWDLKARIRNPNPTISLRRRRRLINRPEALMKDLSPYKILNRILSPIYKISVQFPDTNILMPITASSTVHPYLIYKQVNTVLRDREKRYIYETKINEDKSRFDPLASIGSHVGNYVVGTWEGFDYSEGKQVLQEQIKIETFACYHDGPIVAVRKWSDDQEYTLTIGGKIFCIWHISYKEPLLWRKGKVTYCSGNWGKSHKAVIFLTTMEGVVEYWNLGTNSVAPLRTFTINPGFINIHMRPHVATNIVAYADSRGSCRICTFPQYEAAEQKSLIDRFHKIFRKIHRRKLMLAKWQRDWKQRYGYTQVKFEEVEEPKQNRQSEQREISSVCLARKSKIIDTKNYLKQKNEEYKQREVERMTLILLENKHLRPDELRLQQIPLKKAEAEKASRKIKQRHRLAKANQIFHDNVAINFPNTLRKSPPPPIDPYAGGDSSNSKQQCYNEYVNLKADAKKLIKYNPFHYNFNWNEILKLGYKRRELLDNCYKVSNHRERFQRRLKLLAESDETINAPSVESTYLEEEQEEEEEENEGEVKEEIELAVD